MRAKEANLALRKEAFGDDRNIPHRKVARQLFPAMKSTHGNQGRIYRNFMGGAKPPPRKIP